MVRQSQGSDQTGMTDRLAASKPQIALFRYLRLRHEMFIAKSRVGTTLEDQTSPQGEPSREQNNLGDEYSDLEDPNGNKATSPAYAMNHGATKSQMALSFKGAGTMLSETRPDSHPPLGNGEADASGVRLLMPSIDWLPLPSCQPLE